MSFGDVPPAGVGPYGPLAATSFGDVPGAGVGPYGPLAATSSGTAPPVVVPSGRLGCDAPAAAGTATDRTQARVAVRTLCMMTSRLGDDPRWPLPGLSRFVGGT